MSQDPERAPEELLEALLGRAEERRLARARLRAAGREAELDTLAAGLARAADELCSASLPSPRMEARFVTRVLEATTRRDLSWRGDLRLALDFLRARLRASPALRLVAASLVLHVVAGPVVAYWMLHERVPEKRVTLHVELPSVEPFAPEEAPPVPEEDELLRQARTRELRENELARGRFVLGQRGPSAPVLALEPGAARAVELLARRAQELHAPEQAAAGAGPVPPATDPLALALWIELELDRLTLAGTAAPELGPACQTLAQVTPSASAGVLRLAARALERAARLGLLERTPGTAPAAGTLLDAAWFEALEQAGAEQGFAAHATWRAWLAWGAETAGVSVR